MNQRIQGPRANVASPARPAQAPKPAAAEKGPSIDKDRWNPQGQGRAKADPQFVEAMKRQLEGLREQLREADATTRPKLEAQIAISQEHIRAGKPLPSEIVAGAQNAAAAESAIAGRIEALESQMETADPATKAQLRQQVEALQIQMRQIDPAAALGVKNPAAAMRIAGLQGQLPNADLGETYKLRQQIELVRHMDRKGALPPEVAAASQGTASAKGGIEGRIQSLQASLETADTTEKPKMLHHVDILRFQSRLIDPDAALGVKDPATRARIVGLQRQLQTADLQEAYKLSQEIALLRHEDKNGPMPQAERAAFYAKVAENAGRLGEMETLNAQLQTADSTQAPALLGQSQQLLAEVMADAPLGGEGKPSPKTPRNLLEPLVEAQQKHAEPPAAPPSVIELAGEGAKSLIGLAVEGAKVIGEGVKDLASALPRGPFAPPEPQPNVGQQLSESESARQAAELEAMRNIVPEAPASQREALQALLDRYEKASASEMPALRLERLRIMAPEGAAKALTLESMEPIAQTEAALTEQIAELATEASNADAAEGPELLAQAQQLMAFRAMTQDAGGQIVNAMESGSLSPEQAQKLKEVAPQFPKADFDEMEKLHGQVMAILNS